jgi:hypothetical protein
MYHPPIYRRAPRPERCVSLSELRSLAEQRGLQLVVGDDFALLDVTRKALHRSPGLAEVADWLEARAPCEPLAAPHGGARAMR